VTEDVVIQQVRDYIVRTAGMVSAPGDDERLIDQGFIPSVRMLDLVGFLEDNFAIRMRPIDLVPENLASVRQIAHVVVRRLAARQ